MKTENLSTLKIHKLSEEQYDRELDAGRIDSTALYLTPDNDYSNEDVDNIVERKFDEVKDNLDAHTSNSDIHFTTDEKTKLSGIETGAQKNTVTGVKGDSETSYRTGNINITKANIGLSNVDNTSDANKPVSTAQQSAIDSALASANEYTDTKTANIISDSAVDSKISAHNTSISAHNDLRNLIADLSTKVNNFLDVDDATSDQLSEVLALIESNKDTLDSITSSKINVNDIVDNLTTASATKVLSANQGVAIKALIDALQEEVNGKADSSHAHEISEITNLYSDLDWIAKLDVEYENVYSNEAMVGTPSVSPGNIELMSFSTIENVDGFKKINDGDIVRVTIDNVEYLLKAKPYFSEEEYYCIGNLLLVSSIDGFVCNDPLCIVWSMSQGSGIIFFYLTEKTSINVKVDKLLINDSIRIPKELLPDDVAFSAERDDKLSIKIHDNEHRIEDLEYKYKYLKIPTKISELENDREFITSKEFDAKLDEMDFVTSWNDLQDKPFDDGFTNIITYDGNYSDKEHIKDEIMVAVKVSDFTPTVEQTIGAKCKFYDVTNDKLETIEVTQDMIQEEIGGDSYAFGVMLTESLPFMMVVFETISNGEMSLNKGIYFVQIEGFQYADSITFRENIVPAKTKKLDNKYLDLEWLPIMNKIDGDTLLDIDVEYLNTNRTVHITDKVSFAPNTFKENEELKFCWNEKSYTLKPLVDKSFAPDGDEDVPYTIYAYGNIGMIDDSTYEDTGDPFLFAVIEINGEYNMYHTITLHRTDYRIENEIVSFKIVDFKDKANIIPQQFLPNGYPYSTEGGLVELCNETIEYNEDMGSYIPSTQFSLEDDAEYIVSYNGVDYECTSFVITEDNMTGICVGNTILFDGVGNGMPFVIVYVAGMAMTAIMTLEESTEPIAFVLFKKKKELVHKLDNKYLDLEWLPIYNNKNNRIIYSNEELTKDNIIDYDYFYASLYKPPFEINVNCKYIIEINNVKFTSEVKQLIQDGNIVGYYLGNNPNDLAEFSGINSGEPYSIYWSDSYHTFVIYERSVQTISLTITEIEEEPNIIPQKFLPDGFPYYENKFIDLLPLTTTYIEDNFTISYAVDIKVGNTYTVSFNGVSYDCVGKPFSMDGVNLIVLGNMELLGGEISDEPFAIMCVPPEVLGGGISIRPADTSLTSIIVGIKGYKEVINKLDIRYLPDLDLVGQSRVGITDDDTGEELTAGIGAEIFNHYEMDGNKHPNKAYGEYSTAHGYNTIAKGDYSFAEGIGTKASGWSSHAEGDSTEASGNDSHAEGRSTLVSGECSHAEGRSTQVSSHASHVEGVYTIASGYCQHVQGKYNVEDTEDKYAHIVGNGNFDNVRSNAHTLDWDGNAEFQGDVKANACGGTSPISLVDLYNTIQTMQQTIVELQNKIALLETIESELDEVLGV